MQKENTLSKIKNNKHCFWAVNHFSIFIFLIIPFSLGIYFFEENSWKLIMSPITTFSICYVLACLLKQVHKVLFATFSLLVSIYYILWYCSMLFFVITGIRFDSSLLNLNDFLPTVTDIFSTKTLAGYILISILLLVLFNKSFKGLVCMKRK